MTAPTKPAAPRPLPDLPRLPRPVDPAPILPRHPGYNLTALVEAYRIGLQNSSDWEIEYEARRNATLPPSPLAAEMRHLVDAELEYRRAQRHQDDGLAELLDDTARLREAARDALTELRAAQAQHHRLSGTTWAAVA